MLAKQSTALTLIVGPVLDSSGAEYASAVIGDLSLSKNGGTLTALASAATLTYIANGYYTLVLTTTNTNTLGVAQVSCNKSTYQMPKETLDILPASVYDALVTNATNAVGGLGDIQRMAGTTLTARDIGASVLLSSGTGTGQVKLSSGYVAPNWGDVGNPTTTLNLSGTTVKTATDIATLLAALKRNAFIATDLAIGTVTSQTVFVLTGGPTNDIANVMAIIFDTSASNSPVIAEGSYSGSTGTLTLSAATGITVTTSDTVTLVAVAAASSSVSIASGGITSSSFAAGAINAAAIASDAITDAKVASDVTIASVTGSVGSVANYGTLIADIWAYATSSITTAGSVGKYLLDRIVGTLASGTHSPQTGDAYARIGSPSGASISVDIASVKSVADAVLVDTGELQTNQGNWVTATGFATPANVSDAQSAVLAKLPSALVGGRIDASVGAMASNVVTASSLAADAGTEIADVILSRSVATVESSAAEHSLCTVVLAMLENSISGTTLTIKRTDGSTTHVTKTLSTNANADPITGIT